MTSINIYDHPPLSTKSQHQKLYFLIKSHIIHYFGKVFTNVISGNGFYGTMGDIGTIVTCFHMTSVHMVFGMLEQDTTSLWFLWLFRESHFIPSLLVRKIHG